MAERIRPHPQNVDGPFYVADGCCTACGVPSTSAPELFAWDSRDHCFVARQPSTPHETNQMLRAVRGAELNCIRYRGVDSDILSRFAELGVPELCDKGARFDIRPVVRNQVTFSMQPEGNLSANLLAAQFRSHFLALGADRHRATPVEVDKDGAAFSCAWFEDHFHRISFSSDTKSGSWLVQHQGNRGVSDLLEQWLLERGAERVRWFADADPLRSGPWRATPW
jgi:hypothetical protein